MFSALLPKTQNLPNLPITSSIFTAQNTTGSNHLYTTLELLMMGIMVPETYWESNKICNKNHLLHLVGILFPHVSFKFPQLWCWVFWCSGVLHCVENNLTYPDDIFKRILHAIKLLNCPIHGENFRKTRILSIQAASKTKSWQTCFIWVETDTGDRDLKVSPPRCVSLIRNNKDKIRQYTTGYYSQMFRL